MVHLLEKKGPIYNNLISFMSENGCYFSGEKRTVPRQFVITFRFTFMHLADASIQSDLQLQSGYTFLNQYLCSLGIEPTTLALQRNALPLSHTGSV